MNVVPAFAKIAVGIVVERRKAQSPWIDFTWKPAACIGGPAGRRAVDRPVPRRRRAQPSMPAPPRSSSIAPRPANYRDNLGSGAPMLWVALRPTGVEPPYDVFAVTADPAEGEAWTEAGSDLVDVVPMPETVRATIDGLRGRASCRAGIPQAQARPR